ncbi:MAG: hydroxymethylbilane synthase, partial [Chloroflexi bacterium]|nr:hydroxymethylbilane synthase [Chloroflexota bacterium]
AVHSLKDMPTETPVGLQVTAVTERDDPRDALVSRFGRLAELPSGSIIGTSSIRRRLQLAYHRPDLKIVNIRGNVDTRLEKLSRGDFDGIILAAAALVRLGWQDKISDYLPLEHFLPAPGQGVLAVETRSNDDETIRYVSPVNYLPSWQSITAERAFLKALGGGCRTPIAAFGTVNGDVLRLQGMVAATDGKRMLYASEEGIAKFAEDVGLSLADKLLAMGASDFVTGVGNK